MLPEAVQNNVQGPDQDPPRQPFTKHCAICLAPFVASGHRSKQRVCGRRCQYLQIGLSGLRRALIEFAHVPPLRVQVLIDKVTALVREEVQDVA